MKTTRTHTNKKKKTEGEKSLISEKKNKRDEKGRSPRAERGVVCHGVIVTEKKKEKYLRKGWIPQKEKRKRSRKGVRKGGYAKSNPKTCFKTIQKTGESGR